MRSRDTMRARESMRSGCLFLLALLTAGCAGAPSAPPPGPTADLPGPRIEALLREPPFDRVHWGVLAVDAATGRVGFERNADLLFVPASNMKIPVTAAALGVLGPDYRWETRFYAHERPVDGVLPGDLYLSGEGDPSLGAPFHDPPQRALEALADSLWDAGVREVRGRLVLDASAWDSTTVPESWMIEDLDGTYGATGGAFAIRTGEFEVTVQGASEPGDSARVTWLPAGVAGSGVGHPRPGPFVVHDVTTVAVTEGGADPPELRLEFRPESGHWSLSGEIEVGRSRSFARSGRDPVRLGLSALFGALSDRGIEIRGGSAILWEPGRPVGSRCASGRIPGCAEFLRIAGLASPPLAEIVHATLGPSQNWITEQLVRTLGAERGDGGSLSEGFDVMREYLEAEVGLAPADMHFEDGSGLSAQNLVSPRALTKILEHAAAQPWGELYRRAMAEPGREGTTLESRLGGLEGRVFAKTGTISHVNSLSGWVVARDGREWVFSILSNGSNLPASTVRERIDRIVDVLANPVRTYERGSAPRGSSPPRPARPPGVPRR